MLWNLQGSKEGKETGAPGTARDRSRRPALPGLVPKALTNPTCTAPLLMVSSHS